MIELDDIFGPASETPAGKPATPVSAKTAGRAEGNTSLPRPTAPVEQEADTHGKDGINPRLQELFERLTNFVNLFRVVFDDDWDHTEGAIVEPAFISGTFLHPEVDDVWNNWGNRGALLESYWELVEIMEELGMPTDLWAGPPCKPPPSCCTEWVKDPGDGSEEGRSQGKTAPADPTNGELAARSPPSRVSPSPGKDADVNARLPAGIEWGVAQLEEIRVSRYQQGQYAGKPYFTAMGIVQEPESHNGVKIKGRRTQIGPEPICDTPNSKSNRKTVQDHYGWMLDQIRLLAGPQTEIPFDELDNVVARLEQAKPRFFFRTRTELPNHEVIHEWMGVPEWHGDVEELAPEWGG
jgi:hypothetical protein